ncbi:MAG TPA: hypothetical protein VL173_15680 [Vicinamibacterales bacterium]|nr:hypothetical protein [Vicinamibacterales bacterium]
MRPLIIVALLALSTPAVAQIQSRAADPPIVTAAHETWYVQGDPVQLDGNTFIRAGAAQFFDGDRMVRSGSFMGIPIYVDTTLEPGSVVFVPIGRGLMQPYERPRTGTLAGTTGSRSPSFPIDIVRHEDALPEAPISPTNVVAPGEPATAATREPGAVGTIGIASSPPAVSLAATVDERTSPSPAARATRVPTLVDPAAIRQHIWVEYRGNKWVPAGTPLTLRSDEFAATGNLGGITVYARAGTNDDVIYLPAPGGRVVPYKRKR